MDDNDKKSRTQTSDKKKQTASSLHALRQENADVILSVASAPSSASDVPDVIIRKSKRRKRKKGSKNNKEVQTLITIQRQAQEVIDQAGEYLLQHDNLSKKEQDAVGTLQTTALFISDLANRGINSKEDVQAREIDYAQIVKYFESLYNKGTTNIECNYLVQNDFYDDEQLSSSFKVYGFPLEIYRILSNLINNGCDESFKAEQLDVLLREDDNGNIVITVRDYGIGMPANIVANHNNYRPEQENEEEETKELETKTQDVRVSGGGWGQGLKSAIGLISSIPGATYEITSSKQNADDKSTKDNQISWTNWKLTFPKHDASAKLAKHKVKKMDLVRILHDIKTLVSPYAKSYTNPQTPLTPFSRGVTRHLPGVGNVASNIQSLSVSEPQEEKKGNNEITTAHTSPLQPISSAISNNDVSIEKLELSISKIMQIINSSRGIRTPQTPVHTVMSGDNNKMKHLKVLKVLVVDDNKTNRTVISSMLKKIGILENNIKLVATADEARTILLENEKYNYHFVILDQHLDGGQLGTDIAKACKGKVVGRPAVMVGASKDMESEEYINLRQEAGMSLEKITKGGPIVSELLKNAIFNTHDTWFKPAIKGYFQSDKPIHKSQSDEKISYTSLVQKSTQQVAQSSTQSGSRSMLDLRSFLPQSPSRVNIRGVSQGQTCLPNI